MSTFTLTKDGFGFTNSNNQVKNIIINDSTNKIDFTEFSISITDVENKEQDESAAIAAKAAAIVANLGDQGEDGKKDEGGDGKKDEGGLGTDLGSDANHPASHHINSVYLGTRPGHAGNTMVNDRGVGERGHVIITEPVPTHLTSTMAPL